MKRAGSHRSSMRSHRSTSRDRMTAMPTRRPRRRSPALGRAGTGSRWSFPPSWPAAEVVWPDLSGAIADYPAALGRALDAPEGSARLEDAGRAGSTVAIVVDDPSRWTPVREALPIVLGRLARGGRTSRGRHDQRRGRPAPRRGRRGDASAGRRRGRGRVPLLQPAGGRPLGVRRPGDDARGGAGPGLPAGGRGRPAGPDRLGPAAPPGGVRRRLQADLPGDEPPRRRSGRCTARGWRRRRRRPAARRRRRGQPDAAGDPRGGGDARPVRLDQPPARRPGAGLPRARPGIPTRSRTGSRPRPGGGSGAPTARRRPTWSSRATTPGRATRCRASRSCSSTAPRAGRGASSSASSGPTRPRSTARSRCPRSARSPPPGPPAAGRSAAAWRWPTGSTSAAGQPRPRS